MLNLEQITKKVNELTLKTGEFLTEEVHKIRSSDIEIKGANNFVTYVDKKSEEILMEGLSKILSGTGFIAEESPQLETGDLNWIIDPLDGTTNFIHGVPMFSISIALAEGNKILSAVVLEVNSKELFYTWQDAPCWLDNRQVRVSRTSVIADSLFATGFPYYDFTRMNAYLNFFRYMMEYSHGVRRLGTAAADLAYVACGRYDGFYEYGLSPWDVAAGSLLVSNAGGRVCDFQGGGDFIFGKEIITTNSLIFSEFMSIFKKNFE